MKKRLTIDVKDMCDILFLHFAFNNNICHCKQFVEWILKQSGFLFLQIWKRYFRFAAWGNMNTFIHF